MINNEVPIGGDKANLVCSNCDSTDTIYEEYASSHGPNDSGIGIICKVCGHHEDPDQLGYRFEEEKDDDG